MSFSITVVFRFSRDIQKIVAFSYEDVCKDIFASLCRNKAVDFVPSRIGSYWSGGINGDTEIDVMAVDHQKKQVFAGECKYHNIRMPPSRSALLAVQISKSSISCVSTSVYDNVCRFACPEEFSSI